MDEHIIRLVCCMLIVWFILIAVSSIVYENKHNSLNKKQYITAGFISGPVGWGFLTLISIGYVIYKVMEIIWKKLE